MSSNTPSFLLRRCASILYFCDLCIKSIATVRITEAVKMRKCPGIIFVDGSTGRRARIEGTGIDVWELISVHEELNNDVSAVREAFHWLTDRQIMAAIGYAKAYPDEIQRFIKMNREWSKEKTHTELPFAGKKG